eukprot:CAMPEP_0171217552 /NCGR_PEP_ID=MMETSP0790-20130122/32745_1 /TAXON_ID=2925 /ORGANISM="Alexandrium catenella, Strain OF101" /LENGTH=66 /DNA_ID=CAMNT_0011683347 /DNA_START=18 /DNA_END=215 /DNA_ORIENTATION=-
MGVTPASSIARSLCGAGCPAIRLAAGPATCAPRSAGSTACGAAGPAADCPATASGHEPQGRALMEP